MNTNGTEEPDFQNDPVTDWVLHNETPKNEIPVSSDKDCWFPIHFSFDGIDHTADVLKTERTVTEYHVTAVQPLIDHLPDPYVVASTLSKGAFDFPVNEDYYPQEFGLIIVAAIDNGCNRAEVAIA